MAAPRTRARREVAKEGRDGLDDLWRDVRRTPVLCRRRRPDPLDEPVVELREEAERRVRRRGERRLPRLEVLRRRLGVAPALEDEDGDPEGFHGRSRVVGREVEPVCRRRAGRERPGRRGRRRVEGPDPRHRLPHRGGLLPRRRAGGDDRVDLLRRSLVGRPAVPAEEDEPRERRVVRGDPGREHPAETVAEERDPPRVGLRLRAEERRGRERVVDDLFPHRNREVLHPRPVHVRPLLVAEDDDAAHGEMAREVPEDLRRADRLVTVARARPVDEDERRERPASLGGNRQRSRETPFAVADRHLPLPDFPRLGRRRGVPLPGRRSREDPEAGDPPLRVERHSEEDGRLLEGGPDPGPVHALLRPHDGRREPVQRAELLVERVPDVAEHLLGHRDAHLGGEARENAVEVALLEEGRHLARERLRPRRGSLRRRADGGGEEERGGRREVVHRHRPRPGDRATLPQGWATAAGRSTRRPESHPLPSVPQGTRPPQVEAAGGSFRNSTYE